MAGTAEQFITPQRMLGLVEPLGISLQDAEIPSPEWWDENQEWDPLEYQRATNQIFAEQYGSFTEAVRVAVPGETESRERVWTAENELGSFSIAVCRDERISRDADEYADWLSGPFHAMTIEGPARLEPVEGLITKGAIQKIKIAASQHRWNSHPADSGRDIRASFKLALPKQPKLAVREAGQEDAAPLFVAYVKPVTLRAKDDIGGSDGLLTATALAVKILERLDVDEGTLKEEAERNRRLLDV